MPTNALETADTILGAMPSLPPKRSAAIDVNTILNSTVDT